MNRVIYDPTKESEVASRREEILADPNVATYVDHLKAKRIALVLSGGGGKGAYEAGVLLALFDLGIRDYCALSGTSVGALNAALCHELCRTGDRNVVMKVWGGMAWHRVFTANPIRLVLIMMARLLLAPGLAVAFVKEWLQGKEGANDFAIRFRGLSLARAIKQDLLRIIDYVLLLAIVWPIGRLLNAGERWITIVGMFAVLSVVLSVLARPLVGRYLALLDNAPLRREIVEAVDAIALMESKVPVFCTITGGWEAWTDNRSSIGEIKPVSASTYAELRKMDGPERVLACLLQSAAIPELFPAKPIHGVPFMDGGLVDNTPILPVCLEKPEVIIVVYLDKRVADVDDLWLHEQARTFWLFDLQYRIMLNYDGTHLERMDYKWKREQALASPWAIRLFGRDQFFPIVPSKCLGGLIRGTLNFSERKANALLRLGYSDTLEHIKEAALRE